MDKTSENPLHHSVGMNNSFLKEICNEIRKGALDPAHHEADEIIKKAQADAAAILSKVREEADRLLLETRELLSREKASHEATMKMAARDLLRLLQEKIETQFFDAGIESFLSKLDEKIDPLAHLINAIVEAIQNLGGKKKIQLDLSPYINKELLARAVVKELSELIAQAKVDTHIKGGMVLKVSEGQRHFSLDISSEGLKDLFHELITPSLQKLLFSPTK